MDGVFHMPASYWPHIPSLFQHFNSQPASDWSESLISATEKKSQNEETMIFVYFVNTQAQSVGWSVSQTFGFSLELLETSCFGQCPYLIFVTGATGIPV